MTNFDLARDIRILHAWTVYPVDRPLVDPAEVARFLADHGIRSPRANECAWVTAPSRPRRKV